MDTLFTLRDRPVAPRVWQLDMRGLRAAPTARTQPMRGFEPRYSDHGVLAQACRA